jgi:hypothetical protein
MNWLCYFLSDALKGKGVSEVVFDQQLLLETCLGEVT